MCVHMHIWSNSRLSIFGHADNISSIGHQQARDHIVIVCVCRRFCKREQNDANIPNVAGVRYQKVKVWKSTQFNSYTDLR